MPGVWSELRTPTQTRARGPGATRTERLVDGAATSPRTVLPAEAVVRDRRGARRAALAYKCEPRRRVTTTTHLTDHDLERTARPRVPIADIRAVKA